MFSTRNGMLRYRPHARFQLPSIIPVNAVGDTNVSADTKTKQAKVPLCDKNGTIRFTRPLYRLEWPGEMRSSPEDEPDDLVPGPVLEKLGYTYPENPDGSGRKIEASWSSLYEILQGDPDPRFGPPILGWAPPEELPHAIAYHLAVNARTYRCIRGPCPCDRGYDSDGDGDCPACRPTGRSALSELLTPHVGWMVRRDVAGLPRRRVQQALGAVFALDQQALATLGYLKWMAESHKSHPLLYNFDTCINDELHRVVSTFTQLYFWLLSDFIYDFKERYWLKADWKYHWWQMAGYLFWLGRTGGGAVTKLAGFPQTDSFRREKILEAMPDIAERLDKWQSMHMLLAKDNIDEPDDLLEIGETTAGVSEDEPDLNGVPKGLDPKNSSVTGSHDPLDDGPAPGPVNPKTGQHTNYWVLSEEERAKGFVRPVRYSYRHTECGTVTTMHRDIAETYARDPSYYDSTFCAKCKAHYPVGEFAWEGTAEVVGS